MLRNPNLLEAFVPQSAPHFRGPGPSVCSECFRIGIPFLDHSEHVHPIKPLQKTRVTRIMQAPERNPKP